MDFKPARTILNAFSKLAYAARVNFESIQTERDNGAFLRADRKVRDALVEGADFESAFLASLQEFASKKIVAGSGRRPYFDGARDALSHALQLRADCLAEPFEKACGRLASSEQAELAALSLGRAIENLSRMQSGLLGIYRPTTGAAVLSAVQIESNMERCALCYGAISHAWARYTPASEKAIEELANILRVFESRSENPTEFPRLDRVSDAFARGLSQGSPAYLAALRTKYSEFGLGSCDVLEHAAAIRESVSIAPAAPASALPSRKRTL